MVSLWGELDALEREHRLDFLREPDLGFAWAAYRWAEGDDLDDVLGATDLAAGDFVRWVKQLLDLAGQVADAAGDTAAAQDRARGRRPRCAAAWWPTRHSRSDEHATTALRGDRDRRVRRRDPLHPARDQVGVHVARRRPSCPRTVTV